MLEELVSEKRADSQSLTNSDDGQSSVVRSGSHLYIIRHAETA